MFQILTIIAIAHLVYCPFTKVEESFNLQAIHDILYHKWNISQYDHLEFPGVVPRTFLGPLFISFLSAPFVFILQVLNFSKFWSQYVVRIALALSVVFSFKKLCVTLEKQFGFRWLQWFIAITVTQSHFMFYMSRPLPNIMALPLVLLALDGWLRNDHKSFILFSGAAIVIFRFELAMYLGILLLHDLYYKRIDIKGLLQIAAPGGIAFLLLSVVVDSIFWNRPLWPEGEVLFYNTILNKSSSWGTSPFLWYFYSAIPRGLAASTLLVPIGMFLDPRVRKLVVLSLAFVFLYSFLPHKELRFIIYCFPFLNVAAATACHRIWENRNKSPVYHFFSMGVGGHLAINSIFTIFLLSISGTNYPGGTAISHLHRLARSEQNVHVHIANLAAQTGVSRFTQVNSSWIYDKTEHLRTNDLEIFKFTHLIEEGKSKYAANLKVLSLTHDIIDTIEAFHQISFNYFTIPPIKIKTKPVLFILRRRENYKDILTVRHEHLRMFKDDKLETPTKEEHNEESNEIKREIKEQAAIASDSREESIEETTYLFDPDDRSKKRYNKLPKKEKFMSLEAIDDQEVSDFREPITEELSESVEQPEIALESDLLEDQSGKSIEQLEQSEDQSVEVEDFIEESIEEQHEEISSKKLQKLARSVEIKKRQPSFENFSEELTEKPVKQLSSKRLRKQVKSTESKERYSAPQPKGRKKKTHLEKEVDASVNESTAEVRNETDEAPQLDRLRVKQNIKKIIQKYRRKKLGSEDDYDETAKLDTMPTIYEEITKIEQQILDIIDSNPNIINKEVVKSRLSETIKTELVNAMDPNAVGMVRIDPIKPKKDSHGVSQKSDETTDDKQPSDEVNSKTDSLVDKTKLKFVKKFKKATERLDNIINIIDEIVDTIEVADDDDNEYN